MLTNGVTILMKGKKKSRRKPTRRRHRWCWRKFIVSHDKGIKCGIEKVERVHFVGMESQHQVRAWRKWRLFWKNGTGHWIKLLMRLTRAWDCAGEGYCGLSMFRWLGEWFLCVSACNGLWRALKLLIGPCEDCYEGWVRESPPTSISLIHSLAKAELFLVRNWKFSIHFFLIL